jgi:outer membrane lipoprotein-sorting protein
MLTIRHLAAALLCAAAALSAAAAPQAPPAAPPVAADPRQPADLAQIEAYLNRLTTAQADFTFAGADGSVSHGKFYLSRPNKLRFDYTDPPGNMLLADGTYVIFWDAAQKDASNLPISQTPLAFLLKPHVSLTDGLRVTSFEHSGGMIRAQLVPAKDASEGSVTVAFADQPLELRGWRLVDGQGQTTDVTFANWQFGMALDPSLFHFDATHPGKRPR